MKCQIQWIVGQDRPPQDGNEAIMMIRVKAHVHQINGRGVKMEASAWFPCCAEHARQLSDPGMHIWECKPIEE